MFKTARILAVLAVAAIPVAAISTTAGAQTPYTPYTPYTPGATTPAPTTPAATTPPVPVVVLNAVELAVKKAAKNIQYKDLLNGGKSEKLVIPVPGVGTYKVVVSYRLPGKKYQSIASGAVTVKAPGKTASVALKPNKHGKSILKTVTKLKKKVIKIHLTISYELNGKTISTTISKNIDAS